MKQVSTCIECAATPDQEKASQQKVILSTQRDTSITILGAISAAGVIDVTLRLPGVFYRKKRETNGKEKLEGHQGTRADDFLVFIKNVVDVLTKMTCIT